VKPTPQHATNIEELFALDANFMSAQSLARGLAFKPDSSDIIIYTYPKCGTTWMQQIMHGLRSKRAMDFEEITEVVPWLELMVDLDPDMAQVAAPWVYKSHLCCGEVPKGAQYLNTIRDSANVVLSLYRFFDGWQFERNAISIDDFALHYFTQRSGSLRSWYHILSWWHERHQTQVLLLCYEDMLANPRQAVTRIAQMMSLADTGAVFERALEQSGFAFMKAHERQFDDHLVRAARDAACGLPAHGDASKGMNGISGRGRRCLNNTVIETLNEIWRADITPTTGLRSYALGSCERIRNTVADESVQTHTCQTRAELLARTITARKSHQSHARRRRMF
jgi:hypothetical protein